MRAKRTILFRIGAILLLLVIAGIMMVIGRGHTVYIDNKSIDYNGQTYTTPYKEVVYVDGEQVVLLNGENVNAYLRTEEVGNMASNTSAQPAVRTKLVELQQALAAKSDVIMDGRDIGTVVLPNAQVKIYLTASSMVRARRRYDELTAKGETCDLEKIRQDIEDRDYRDMHRETSPLKQAEDAVLVDTSDMTIEQVIDRIVELIG